MKKLIVWSLVISMCALLLTACGNGQEASRGNYTDEMKIPYSCDLSAEDGADSVERQGDHQGALILTPWVSIIWRPATP